MKKILFVSLFLLCSAALVFAVSADTAKPGEDYTFSVTVPETVDISEGALELVLKNTEDEIFSISEEVFDVVSGEWSFDAFLRDFDTSTGKGIFVSLLPITIESEGTVLNFTVRLRDDLTKCQEVEISANMIFKNNNTLDEYKFIRVLSSKYVHASLQWIDAIPATCTEDGEKAHYNCAVCGRNFDEDFAELDDVSIPALGHDLVANEAKEANCTEIGWEAYNTCSRCDYTTYVEIAVLGHDLVAHEAKEATCTEIGWETYNTCSRCDYTTYVEIAALGHDLIAHEAKEPTCRQVGWAAYNTCSRCDYTTYAEIGSIGHSGVVDAAVASTCTETGLSEGVHCSVCGDILVAQSVVAALGHDEVVIPAVNATTQKTGLTEGKKCSRCGEILVKQEAVPMRTISFAWLIWPAIALLVIGLGVCVTIVVSKEKKR